MNYYKLFLLFLISMFMSFIVSVWLLGEPDCSLGSTVSKIGGCDEQGYCGVVYNDGFKGILQYPVVGELCNAEK